MNKTEVSCPGCEYEGKGVGKHWRYYPKHRPELTKQQWEIAVGLWLGDATLPHRTVSARIPKLEVMSVEKEYVKHLENIFGILGITALERTAEEQTEKMEDYADFEGYEYSEVYRFSTRPHPSFEEFLGWYDGVEKKFPDVPLLTPTTLKYWYVSDGHMTEQGSITIGIASQWERKEWFENQFRVLNSEPTFSSSSIWFSVKESQQLLDYMGEPVPGFEKKWRIERT